MKNSKEERSLAKQKAVELKAKTDLVKEANPALRCVEIAERQIKRLLGYKITNDIQRYTPLYNEDIETIFKNENLNLPVIELKTVLGYFQNLRAKIFVKLQDM